jgi:hypothetical protein
MFGNEKKTLNPDVESGEEVGAAKPRVPSPESRVLVGGGKTICRQEPKKLGLPPPPIAKGKRVWSAWHSGLRRQSQSLDVFCNKNIRHCCCIHDAVLDGSGQLGQSEIVGHGIFTGKSNQQVSFADGPALSIPWSPSDSDWMCLKRQTQHCQGSIHPVPFAPRRFDLDGCCQRSALRQHDGRPGLIKHGCQ